MKTMQHFISASLLSALLITIPFQKSTAQIEDPRKTLRRLEKDTKKAAHKLDKGRRKVQENIIDTADRAARDLGDISRDVNREAIRTGENIERFFHDSGEAIDHAGRDVGDFYEENKEIIHIAIALAVVAYTACYTGCDFILGEFTVSGAAAGSTTFGAGISYALISDNDDESSVEPVFWVRDETGRTTGTLDIAAQPTRNPASLESKVIRGSNSTDKLMMAYAIAVLEVDYERTLIEGQILPGFEDFKEGSNSNHKFEKAHRIKVVDSEEYWRGVSDRSKFVVDRLLPRTLGVLNLALKPNKAQAPSPTGAERALGEYKQIQRELRPEINRYKNFLRKEIYAK